MQAADVLGWTSSLVLVVTLGHQVYSQWKSGRSDGVSIWLFVGQLAASTGFTIYSVLVRNWVFIVTNSLLLASAIVGFAITHHQQRKKRGRASARASSILTFDAP